MDEIKPEDILFLDIETVAAAKDYASLPDNWKAFWDTKAGYLARNNESPEELYPRAAIYAEFGKIICISVGFIVMRDGQRTFRIKSFAGHDEAELLSDFTALLDKHFNQRKHRLAAHNGKEFDFPYLGRRMLVNNLKLPKLLRLQGLKSWEVKHIDTMQLWKFGDIKSFVSLDLLATILGIESPKAALDGSKIYEAYYLHNDMPNIIKYCQNDVLALARIYLKLSGHAMLTDDEVVVVE
jgi:uncharacterized protein YprB with RNaseH-like and TPR domain